MPSRPLIGAHVPVGGGLAKQGLRYADRVGAEVVQVFVGNPRGWAPATGSPREDATFRGSTVPAFVHAPYLINFGSPNPATLVSSGLALVHTLSRAAAIGARGVVVHTGSAVTAGSRSRALSQVREALLPVLDGIADGGPDLLLEPTAGGGEPIAATVEQLGELMALLDRHPRVGICLDTCHAFAAGEDLRARGGVTRVLDALVDAVGDGRLKLVHANDSMDPLGSTRDRHEAIGAGHLGAAVFRSLVRHPAVRRAAVVIETPGDEAGHMRDIALLKGYRSGRRAGPA